jgi:hypothetical protein
MTPLQRVAMGLVIVVVDTLGGYDLLPDVAGWALVLWGVGGLPGPDRGGLRGAALVAAVTSMALYPPAVHEPLADADPSLQWAASLPDLVFALLLTRTLMRLARPTDRRTAARMRVLVIAFAVLAVAPVLVFAAGAERLLPAATLLVQVLWVWLVWNLFAVNTRPYATTEPPAAEAAGGS